MQFVRLIIQNTGILGAGSKCIEKIYTSFEQFKTLVLERYSVLCRKFVQPLTRMRVLNVDTHVSTLL